MTAASLAIVIPTYQREEILQATLPPMLAETMALGVDIHVSDDSLTDDTAALISTLQRDHPNLRYRRNRPRLGHDANLVASIVWPSADYVWLLGDSVLIRPGKIRDVMATLGVQDLAFVNSHAGKPPVMAFATGADAHALARETLWHQALTGTTIYSRPVIDWFAHARERGFTTSANFPQLSIILGYLAQVGGSVSWFAQPSFEGVAKKSYWRDRTLDVFVNDWVALIEAFPDVVPPRLAPDVIRSHSMNMRLFTAKMLVGLRISGQFRWASLRRRRIFQAIHINRWKVILLLCIPAGALRLGRWTRDRMSGSVWP